MRLPHLLCASLLLGAMACTAPPKSVTPLTGRVASISFRLEERRADGTDVILRPNAEIDRDSMIRVAFDQADPDGRSAAPPDARWVALNEWLGGLEQMLVARSELETRASGELRPSEVAGMIDEIEAFDEQHVEPLFEQGRELLERTAQGRSQLELREEDQSALEMFSDFFAHELAALDQHLAQDLGGEHAGYVLVSAFADRAGADPVRLPVRGYDNIESKSPTVAPLLGLSLSSAERERVSAELAQAQKAVEVLRRLDGRLEELVERSRELARELRANLERLVAELGARRGWQAFVQQLATAERTGLDARQAAALDALLALAQACTPLVEGAEALAALARAVRDLDLDLGGALTQLLDGASPLRQALERVRQATTRLHADLGAARAASQAASAALAGVDLEQLLDLALAALAPEERAAMLRWSSEARSFLDGLAPLLDVVRVALEHFGQDRRELELAQAAVRAGDGISIPRSIDDLADGFVLLGENVAEGDAVRVEVQALASVGGKPGEPVGQPERFDFRVTRFGWRRAVHGEAMLVRGTSGGTGSRYEPNVVVMASWHHKIREPSGLGAAMASSSSWFSCWPAPA